MRTILLSIALVSQAVNAATLQDSLSGNETEQVCSTTTMSIVGRFLGVKAFNQEVGESVSLIKAAACKKSPENQRITIAAFAYDIGKEDAKAIVVTLVDESARKVVASFRSEVGEDAAMRVDTNSLRIDTAAYNLAPGVRAFGMDLTSGYNPNCGGGGTGAERTLYVQEGKQLRPIFGLTMSSWNYTKGDSPRCTSDAESAEYAVIEYTDFSIGVAGTHTNGYRDLTISAITYNDSEEKPKTGSVLYRVRYDGREYRP
ncbi:MAG: hypothetical protein IPG25_09320 [Proteobacteria bacterium]|nr:hypothetical protein [Pseudomonadota bacterium]